MNKTLNQKWITNKFKTCCLDCKRHVNKTERVLYIPSLKGIKCIDCGTFTRDSAQENAYQAAVEEKMGMNTERYRLTNY